MARTRFTERPQASAPAWPTDLRLHPGPQQRSAASPFSSCCSSPRPVTPDPQTCKSLEQFLAAARECVVVLPPPEATLGHLPAPGTPLQAEFRPEPVASKAQHSERVALCAENLSKQQQQQQTATLPPPSQTAQVPGAADGEQLHFAARKWQQETIPAGGGAALQYLSPLGPEAAFVQPRSSFEAKWGRWVESMVDHVLESMPTSDSASELHSEYGGVAAELPATQTAAGVSETAAAAANPMAATADPMVNPIGLSRAEENAMRSDSAAVGGGRLAGRIAAQHAIGGLRRHSKQAAAPPGWKPSTAAGDGTTAASAALPSAVAPEQQRRSRLSAGAVAHPDNVAAKFGERLLQRFRDPALERRFRMSQAALLRPVDVIGSFVVTIAAVATGFVPAPLLATAPVAWPLVVMAPGSRTLLASRLPHQTYFRWRELIAVLSSLLTLIHGVLVLCPGFVPFLPANRLTNPLLFVRLIGGEMQLFLGAFNRVRFCVWLPVQLIGNLIAVAALPRMGELFEAAGAAPAASVVAWGAAYHLTLGLLLPGAFLWMLERRERRQFLAHLRQAAQSDPKAAVAAMHGKTA